MSSRFLFVILIVSVVFSSCNINPEFMFQTPDDFVFDVPVIDSTAIDYTIQPNDLISFDLYTNEGAMMLEFTTSGVEQSSYSPGVGFQFIVDSRGYVEFPVIGEQKISSMTVQQAQDFIEESYEHQFNGPYAVLKVLNRRAVIFKSPAGTANVITLQNQGISVIEAIASAGGLGLNGLAKNVKVIRKVGDKREVYQLDLSKIDGIRYADMAVEAGDIIYIQETRKSGRAVIQDIQPYITFISSLSLAVAVILRVI